MAGVNEGFREKGKIYNAAHISVIVNSQVCPSSPGVPLNPPCSYTVRRCILYCRCDRTQILRFNSV